MKCFLGKILIIMLIKKICIYFFMFFSVSVFAENTRIVKYIEFEGLENTSKHEALQNITFKVGSKISQNDVKDSIKSLFKTGKFEDIKVVFSTQKIIFNVYERPIISSVFIFGNNIINSTLLDKYLTELNMKKGDILSAFTENIFIKTIKDFYYNIGRYKFNVKILKKFGTNNTVDLQIIIDEGLPIKVNKIKIFGAKKVSENKIISFFKLKSRSSWWNFFHKTTYSPQELENDLNRLNKFYLNQGYFYFNIDTKKVHYFKDKNFVDIEIYISEGEKYKISDIFINGELLEYRPLISNIININRNELYNKEKINSILNKIKRFLSEHGYIDSEIIVIPEINHEKKKIILNFNINIKKKFFVKRIFFQGNELTKDKVLRRLIKQIEGKYFNLKLIESGKELLENTKYFNNVEIIQKKISPDSNKVNITYKVKEQPTGSINFGLGYGIDSGLSFNTAFSQDNIFGSGNSLNFSVVKNKNQKYTDISINYPYFFFDKTDLNTRFFYNDFKYNLNTISNLTKNTYGFESNLGFAIDDVNKVNFGLGYSHNGVVHTEKKIEDSFLNKKLLLNKHLFKNSLVNDFTLNYSWIYNTFKYIYFPISGNQTYITGKNTIPGSDNSFYKIILDSEQYIPLDKEKNFIFLSHVHMGIGDSLNKDKLPFYENFYANSVNNIRGFRSNTIGPKTIYDNTDLENCIGYKNNNICESIDSIGGNATFSTNLELITPIPFLDEVYSKFFRSSIFFDVGNIWDTKLNNINRMNLSNYLKNNILDDLYSSFGLSLQWFSPIGPLVFSYAIPVQKNKHHQLEAFQFNIGKNW